MTGALPIPVEALDDAGIVLGRRGSGKSNLLMTLFEHELDAGRRSVLIDPKGDRWGVRMKPDGSPSRFDIPIFGGTHGDRPVDETMGEQLGRIVAEHDLSCLIDLSLLSLGGKQKFMMGFAPTLLQYNTAALTLFLEEVDQFANQDPRYQPAMLVHHIANFATLGRQRGIVPWVASQRPAKVNATVRSQADTFIAMKVTSPLDRDAYRDWFKGHGKDAAARVEEEVGRLQPGEALVWVGATEFFDKVRFPLASTYDSGRTPKHGERIDAVFLPKLSNAAILDLLRRAPAGEPESQKSEKPDRDARIAELEDALEMLEASDAMELVARDKRIAELEAVVADQRAELDHLREADAMLDGYVDGLIAIDALVQSIQNGAFRANLHRGDADLQSAPAAPTAAAPSRSPSPADAITLLKSAEVRSGAERENRALSGLTAVHPAGLTEAAWAARTGYARKGGAWLRRRKRYLDNGLIEQRDGRWFATAAGIEQAGAEIPDMPPPGLLLVKWWSDRLTASAARRALQLLAAVHPKALTRDAIAAELGMAPKGGAFLRALTEIKAAELATESGKRVAVASMLMEGH